MSLTTDCPACRSPRVKARQTRKPIVTDASESSIMIVAIAFVDGSGAGGSPATPTQGAEILGIGPRRVKRADSG